MTIEEVKQELRVSGKDPDDYNISIDNNAVEISPKTETQKLNEARERINLMQSALDELLLGGS